MNQQCCEDNPDALTHHELLLPGHLLAKFAKEKLEDCLAAIKWVAVHTCAVCQATACHTIMRWSATKLHQLLQAL